MENPSCEPYFCSGWWGQVGHIPRTQLYVLDKQWLPQPVGVYGELYIGGPQVGLGYLARPSLTAEKFVVNPFAGSSENP
eukprot:538307-Amphidinium_carterae.1